MNFDSYKLFSEESTCGEEYRKEYLNGIVDFVEEYKNKMSDERDKFIDPVKLKNNKQYYLDKLVDMLGYPLTEYCYGIPDVKKEFVGEDELCKIYRMKINTINNIWFYGVLSVPKTEGKHPLIIAQHGGGGTPELINDMHGNNAYDHIAKIALKNDCVVFSPQLLLWNYKEKLDTCPHYNIEYSRVSVDNQLKQCGGSITALEIYNIRKSLDYLLSMDIVDKERVGMVGLSYGGYFTMHTMAVDKRIKSGYACGFFNNREKECFGDWAYFNSLKMFSDAEVAGICAPRSLFVDVGKKDEVFDYKTSISEAQRAESYFKIYEENNFSYNLWDGGHRIDVNGPNINCFFESIK